MNDLGLADAVDANYWESFRLMTDASGGDILEHDGVLAIATGAPVAMLNVAFVTQALREPRTALAQAVAFFDARRLPFVVRVREGIDMASEEAATDLGMPYSDTVPGMALHPMPVPPPPPRDLEIRTVEDTETLSLFRRVLAEGFGMPLSISEKLVTAEWIGRDGLDLFVGLVGGVAVATSTLASTAPAAGVYNVATVDGFRRRGIGEAMTWHCLSRGQQRGCSVGVLQSSSMGKPVYERMGFRTVAPYRTFHRPKPV